MEIITNRQGYIFLPQKFFYSPPLDVISFFLPCCGERKDIKLWSHQRGLYKYYSRKCSVKTKFEGKIMKYPWKSITKVMIYGNKDVRFVFPSLIVDIFLSIPPPLRGGEQVRIYCSANRQIFSASTLGFHLNNRKFELFSDFLRKFLEKNFYLS